MTTTDCGTPHSQQNVYELSIIHYTGVPFDVESKVFVDAILKRPKSDTQNFS